MNAIFLFTLIALLLSDNVRANDDVDHICTEKKDFSEEVVTKKEEPFKIQVYKFSVWPPFIRREEKVAYRTIDSKEVHLKTRVIQVCCKGYEKQGEICVPSCPNGCSHGQCIQPEVCSCEAGWMGTHCNETCEEGKFGANCDEYCRCSENSICDSQDGKCLCHDGYIGETCHKKCPQGFYGPNCNSPCLCLHGGTCDHETGKCTCASGFEGTHCQFTCRSGTFGRRCRKKCTCANGGICHHTTGKCQCPNGFMGEDCSLPCQDGFYGPNCAKSCDCAHAESCDPKVGSCNCDPGWTDTKCLTPCPVGSFGQNCNESCNCTGMQICDHVAGCVDIKMVDLEGILIHDQTIVPERVQNETANADVLQKPTKWSMSGLNLLLVLITGIFFAILSTLILFFVLYKPKNSMDPQRLVESKSTINSNSSGVYSIPEKSPIYEEVGPRKSFCEKEINVTCSIKTGNENPAFNNLDK